MYSKGLFMYIVLNNEAQNANPPSCYSDSRNYLLSLPAPRTDILKTRIAFSGTFLWNNLPLTVGSCHSLSSFKRKLCVRPYAIRLKQCFVADVMGNDACAYYSFVNTPWGSSITFPVSSSRNCHQHQRYSWNWKWQQLQRLEHRNILI